MEIVRGRSVLKRTAVGRLQYYEKEEPSVVRRQVEDTERELSRYAGTPSLCKKAPPSGRISPGPGENGLAKRGNSWQTDASLRGFRGRTNDGNES